MYILRVKKHNLWYGTIFVSDGYKKTENSNNKKREDDDTKKRGEIIIVGKFYPFCADYVEVKSRDS